MPIAMPRAPTAAAARRARARAGASGSARRAGPSQRSAASSQRSRRAPARALVVRAPVDARQRGLEVQAVHRQAAAGHVGGQRRGGLARDQRVDRVVEAQLQPRAEVVEQRRAHLGPAVGGDHDVDAVGQAGRGELLDRGRGPRSRAERRPAVDDRHEVRERRRGAARASRIAVAAELAERASRSSISAAQLARRRAARPRGRACRRRRRRGARRSARAAGRRRGRWRRPAACAGVWREDQRGGSVRSSVLLPVRGAPTTARWPPAPARSSDERLGALLGRAVDQADGRAQPVGAVPRPGRRVAAPRRAARPRAAAGPRPGGRPRPAASRSTSTCRSLRAAGRRRAPAPPAARGAARRRRTRAPARAAARRRRRGVGRGGERGAEALVELVSTFR